MSMNRFVGLGVFALSSSVLITLAACDDSATTAAATGGTTATGTGGSGTTATGNGGTSTGNGGTTATGNGGSGNTTPGGCDASTNLIANALTSTTFNWIGGDGTLTTDNPCGVQGAIYAYSDKGLDGAIGGTDASVQSPALDTVAGGETRLTPCSADKGCCISGATSKWPVSGTTTDYTASVWGGGLGVSLNDPGEGGTKQAFAGSIKGLNVTVAGTLNGQVLRVGYTQTATDACAPFITQTSVGTFAVPFTGSIACPTWSCTPACVPPTSTPYDLQVQVVGGDSAGAFDICITSITPIL